MIGADGLPSVLLWSYVDNARIHGPSKSKLVTALECILDVALTLGLVCHSSKIVLPIQQIKLCGFVYNTQAAPYMTIPSNKVYQALFTIRYVQYGWDCQFSCFLVSMVVCFLQSLVPSTPDNIGAIFLQPLYQDLYRPQINDSPGTKKFYFRTAILS